MKRMVFLAMFLATAALAQEPVIKLEPTPLVLPARLGPLLANPQPHRYDKPGMGASWQYRMSGAILTVYVYDAEEKNLQDGADTPPVCVEFEVAKQGALQTYANSKLVSQHLVKLLPPEEAPAMREAVLEMDREGQRVTSYVWISAVAGQFIKLRFTIDQRLQDEVQDARRAILSALGTAIQPHLKPVAADAGKPGATIGITLSMLDEDVGASGLMYSVMLTALAEENPDLAPLCGGEIVPSFDTELSLYRGVFLGELDSPLARQIDKADKAGFLEELVWTEVHRESWGETPPAGLMLDEYRVWKKKNLKRFKPPAFGTVTIDHPRPLPPEPEAAAASTPGSP
jgi:hypothetical protein